MNSFKKERQSEVRIQVKFGKRWWKLGKGRNRKVGIKDSDWPAEIDTNDTTDRQID